MMKYPMRPAQHVSETRSMMVLRSQLPAEWVVRSLEERDYGIDLLIEMSREGRMTGQTIVAQVKAMKRVPFASNEASFRGLRLATYNYLVAQPAPSYLFVVSLADEKVYWRSLREHHRERRPGRRASHVPLDRRLDLSDAGRIALDLSRMTESAWPHVETAVVAALMFFNALGPLCLACRRLPRSRSLPSSVQHLLMSHYQNNALIQTHLVRSGKRYEEPPDIYKRALVNDAMSVDFIFKAGFAFDLLKMFIWDYVFSIELCDRTVRVDQRSYWIAKYPFLVAHLDAFPPYFASEDWFARYFFDEYEKETKHINLDMFSDVDGATRNDFSMSMNTRVVG